jgi:hypothetical protein
MKSHNAGITNKNLLTFNYLPFDFAYSARILYPYGSLCFKTINMIRAKN